MEHSDLCIRIPLGHGDDGRAVMMYHEGGSTSPQASSWWTTSSSLSSLGVDIAQLPLGSRWYVGDDSSAFDLVESSGMEVPALDDDLDLALVPCAVRHPLLSADI